MAAATIPASRAPSMAGVALALTLQLRCNDQRVGLRGPARFDGAAKLRDEHAFLVYGWLSLKFTVTRIRTSIGTQSNSVELNCH
jgi:hypothetical protein